MSLNVLTGDGVVHADTRVDPGEGPVNPEDFALVTVEDVCCEAAVRSQHLTRHGLSEAVVLLREVSNGLTSSVHQYVAVGLLEAEKDVHHFDLSLDDDGAMIEDGHGGVIGLEHAIWIVRYTYGCDQVGGFILGQSRLHELEACGWLCWLLLLR